MLKRLAAAATVAVMAAPPAAAVPLVGSQGADKARGEVAA